MKPAEKPSSRKPVEATTRRPATTKTTRRTTTEEPDYYPDEDPEENPDLFDPIEVCAQGRLFVADDRDCAIYYQCDHGTPHKKT